MKSPAFVPATSGLASPLGGRGPAARRVTIVPLIASERGVHVAPPSTLWNMGIVPFPPSPPATSFTGGLTAATATASMLVPVSPDAVQLDPLSLRYTPPSVAAATS